MKDAGNGRLRQKAPFCLLLLPWIRSYKLGQEDYCFFMSVNLCKCLFFLSAKYCDQWSLGLDILGETLTIFICP